MMKNNPNRGSDIGTPAEIADRFHSTRAAVISAQENVVRKWNSDSDDEGYAEATAAHQRALDEFRIATKALDRLCNELSRVQITEEMLLAAAETTDRSGGLTADSVREIPTTSRH